MGGGRVSDRDAGRGMRDKRLLQPTTYDLIAITHISRPCTSRLPAAPPGVRIVGGTIAVMADDGSDRVGSRTPALFWPLFALGTFVLGLALGLAIDSRTPPPAADLDAQLQQKLQQFLNQRTADPSALPDTERERHARELLDRWLDQQTRDDAALPSDDDIPPLGTDRPAEPTPAPR